LRSVYGFVHGGVVFHIVLKWCWWCKR
jgi:hypothetical protein